MCIVASSPGPKYGECGASFTPCAFAIAATRITTDDLPAVVVLSDSDTMIAGRDLSSVNDVEIVARVAYGGTAVTASGDLIGRAVQKKGGSENLDVVINQVQP